MYAVIETGGKQYRVAQGDVIKVELLDAEAQRRGFRPGSDGGKDGETPVLGAPFISGGKVTGKVKSNGRHDRLFTFKLRRARTIAAARSSSAFHRSRDHRYHRLKV